jgi:hypothetical protein
LCISGWRLFSLVLPVCQVNQSWSWSKTVNYSVAIIYLLYWCLGLSAVELSQETLSWLRLKAVAQWWGNFYSVTIIFCICNSTGTVPVPVVSLGLSAGELSQETLSRLQLKAVARLSDKDLLSAFAIVVWLVSLGLSAGELSQETLSWTQLKAVPQLRDVDLLQCTQDQQKVRYWYRSGSFKTHNCTWYLPVTVTIFSLKKNLQPNF